MANKEFRVIIYFLREYLSFVRNHTNFYAKVVLCEIKLKISFMLSLVSHICFISSPSCVKEDELIKQIFLTNKKMHYIFSFTSHKTKGKKKRGKNIIQLHNHHF